MDSLNLSFPEICAYCGAFVQLFAYFLLQAGIIPGRGYVYASFNLVSSTLVLTGLLVFFNPSTAISQSTVLTISLFGIIRTYLITSGVKFSPEEKKFLDAKLPKLSRMSARKLLNLVHWKRADVGEVLTIEGQEIGKLVFVSSGKLEVEAAGLIVGEIGEGGFLGEMSVLSGGPASATVRVVEPVRYFEISSELLHRLCKRNDVLRLHLENSITRDLCGKLLNANRRATGAVAQPEFASSLA